MKIHLVIRGARNSYERQTILGAFAERKDALRLIATMIKTRVDAWLPEVEQKVSAITGPPEIAEEMLIAIRDQLLHIGEQLQREELEQLIGFRFCGANPHKQWACFGILTMEVQ